MGNLAVTSAPGSRARGYTVLEMAVALVVLAAGSAVVWYGLRTASRMDRLNREHHAALMLARSDLESLRSIPRADIHDTAYRGPGASGDSLLLVRTVMDSARIVATLNEIELDDKLSPKELRKPLEVRVSVYPAPAPAGNGVSDLGEVERASEGETGGQSLGGGSLSGDAGGANPKASPLATLLLKLPEYKWY